MLFDDYKSKERPSYYTNNDKRHACIDLHMVNNSNAHCTSVLGYLGASTDQKAPPSILISEQIASFAHPDVVTWVHRVPASVDNQHLCCIHTPTSIHLRTINVILEFYKFVVHEVIQMCDLLILLQHVVNLNLVIGNEKIVLK